MPRMTKKERKEKLAAIDAWAKDVGTEVLLLGDARKREDFMPAVLGVVTKPYPAVVYSGPLIVECLMRMNKWTYEEAIEWYSYNTIRSLDYYANAPIIVEEVLDG